MKTHLLLFLCLAVLSKAPAADPVKRILFFTKSQRTEHSVIKRTGNTSFAENVLNTLAATNGWQIETSKDGRIFTPEQISKYDAFLFYSNGTLTEPGKDGSPPMTEEGKAVLIEAVRKGKPFIGVHTALTTFNKKPGPVDPYLQMLGAEGISHNEQQKARNICVDPKFPGFENLQNGLELFEEWYSIKNYSKDLHVLLVQDTRAMVGNLYERRNYPATWARMYGKGRVFVTALGHREDIWTNPAFQRILIGGVSWAVGKVEADITPNIEKVAPHYADLPPEK